MFNRLSKLIKGFLSMFISNLEMANPKALLEAEIASFHEAVGQYNQNLAKQAALVEKLRGTIEKQKREVDRMKARIQAMVNAKQMEEAGRLALSAKTIQQQLAENETAFSQADQLYKNLTKQRDVYVREAQKRIDAIKQKLSQAEISESQAKLAEIATATSFDLAGTGATLERLEEKLDERVNLAKGKARVAADSAAHGEWTIRAEEEAALEAQALSEFLTASGMSDTAPPAMETAQRQAISDLGG